MPNIVNISLLQDENGNYLSGAVTAIDLQCNNGTSDVNKDIRGVYITDVGGVITEVDIPFPNGSKFVTKIVNTCNGKFAYSTMPAGEISDMLTFDCSLCQPIIPSNTVMTTLAPITYDVPDIENGSYHHATLSYPSLLQSTSKTFSYLYNPSVSDRIYTHIECINDGQISLKVFNTGGTTVPVGTITITPTIFQ